MCTLSSGASSKNFAATPKLLSILAPAAFFEALQELKRMKNENIKRITTIC